MAQTTTITATIARVNDRGFQTREEPGRWFNVSRYAEPAPAIPPAGTACRVTIDGSGFVRQLAPLEADMPETASEPRPKRFQDSRDTAITRLAVLKAAAAFCASQPDAESTDVLAVAAAWEAWVTR